MSLSCTGLGRRKMTRAKMQQKWPKTNWKPGVRRSSTGFMTSERGRNQRDFDMNQPWSWKSSQHLPPPCHKLWFPVCWHRCCPAHPWPTLSPCCGGRWQWPQLCPGQQLPPAKLAAADWPYTVSCKSRQRGDQTSSWLCWWVGWSLCQGQQVQATTCTKVRQQERGPRINGYIGDFAIHFCAFMANEQDY